MISKQFPTNYDVEQTIKYRTTSYDEIKKFFQTQGLFNIGRSKDHIAEFASGLLLEHQNYLVLRRIAQGASGAANISGFTLKSIKIAVDAKQMLEDIERLRNELIEGGNISTQDGKPFQQLSNPAIIDSKIYLKFIYQRLIPGRVELMERVDTNIDLGLEQISPSQWRVICYPQANQDVKILERLFSKLGPGIYETLILSLETFTQKQRILFFDLIIDYYQTHEEWQCQQVVGITVKQPTRHDPIFLDLGNDDEETDVDDLEASEDDLKSINQAILKGNHLRTNSFIRRCEAQGFYFPSMTFIFANRKSSEIIKLTIQFKLSPKLFEVILNDMVENTEMGEIPALFTAERQKEILREFWDVSHKIWHSIYEDNPTPKNNLQLTLADAVDKKRIY